MGLTEYAETGNRQAQGLLFLAIFGNNVEDAFGPLRSIA